MQPLHSSTNWHFAVVSIHAGRRCASTSPAWLMLLWQQSMGRRRQTVKLGGSRPSRCCSRQPHTSPPCLNPPARPGTAATSWPGRWLCGAAAAACAALDCICFCEDVTRSLTMSGWEPSCAEPSSILLHVLQRPLPARTRCVPASLLPPRAAARLGAACSNARPCPDRGRRHWWQHGGGCQRGATPAAAACWTANPWSCIACGASCSCCRNAERCACVGGACDACRGGRHCPQPVAHPGHSGAPPGV